ncbi:TPA: DUF3862 domain-containing protein [Streptococcus agalactiae]
MIPLKKITVGTIVCLSFLGLTACSSSNTQQTSTSKSNVSQHKNIKADHEELRLKFNKVKLGVKANNFKGGTSLAELKQLFGGEPNEKFDTPAGNVTLKGYRWNVDDISITIQLLNDSSIVRSISNFKFIRDANITTKDYNSLKNGMSYNKVKELLGEPDDIYQAVSSDKEELQAAWISGIQSSDSDPGINLTFENDKLTNKQQHGLK